MFARGKPLFWTGFQCPCLFVGNWTKSLKRASLEIWIVFLLSPGLILRPKQQTIGRNCITQLSVVLVPGFPAGRAQVTKKHPLCPWNLQLEEYPPGDEQWFYCQPPTCCAANDIPLLSPHRPLWLCNDRDTCIWGVAGRRYLCFPSRQLLILHVRNVFLGSHTRAA